MRCCATCRGHRSLHWHRSRFPANGAAPRGGPVSEGKSAGVGRAGGLRRGRCKYVHVSSVAASMRLTPPQPDPPRLRQILATCSRSTTCVDALHSIVEIFDFNGDSSTHGVDLTCRPRSTPTNSRRNLSEAGRCRSAGCQPHGCGCQASMDGFTASPHSDTAPPTHGMPAFDVDVALA